MDFDLERFIKAQDDDGMYRTAIKEITDGKKRSHWIWYVFPQLHGLGRSDMAVRYGISSLDEAVAYLSHGELRKRLYHAVRALIENNRGRDIESVLGYIDAMKLRSCLTLFDAVEPGDEFGRALRIFFNDERDEKTLEMISDTPSE